MAGLSRDAAIHFVCMDWRHMGEVLDAAKGVYPELKNLCVWNKDNAGMSATAAVGGLGAGKMLSKSPLKSPR